MANVSILFNGKEYLLSCEDGQEEHLEELTKKLNLRFNELKNSLGNIGENKLLLITSISILDEFYETQKNISDKKIEINNLTDKFKELKSLVYNYRDEKEKLISDLSFKQKEISGELEKNKDDYEKFLDKTTMQIESFLTKLSKNNLIQ